MLRRLSAFGIVAFLAMTAALIFRQSPAEVAEPRFELRASESQGHVKLDWNPTSPLVRGADSALLEATDDTGNHRYNVNKEVLETGGLDYNKKSPGLFLRFSLLREGRPTSQAQVRLTQSSSSVAVP